MTTSSPLVPAMGVLVTSLAFGACMRADDGTNYLARFSPDRQGVLVLQTEAYSDSDCLWTCADSSKIDPKFRIATTSSAELPIDASALPYGGWHQGQYGTVHFANQAGYSLIQVVDINSNLRTLKISSDDTQQEIAVAGHTLLHAIPSPDGQTIAVVLSANNSNEISRVAILDAIELMPVMETEVSGLYNGRLGWLDSHQFAVAYAYEYAMVLNLESLSASPRILAADDCWVNRGNGDNWNLDGSYLRVDGQDLIFLDTNAGVNPCP